MPIEQQHIGWGEELGGVGMAGGLFARVGYATGWLCHSGQVLDTCEPLTYSMSQVFSLKTKNVELRKWLHSGYIG